MNNPVLTDVKVRLGMNGVNLVNKRLIEEINTCLVYLSINAIPVCEIDSNTTVQSFIDLGLKEGDYMLVLAYVTADIKITENLTNMSNTVVNVLNEVKKRNLWTLKVRYDA